METEQEALARLADDGYQSEFEIVEDGVRCPECGEVVAPEDVEIDETVRFEGPSNPDDQSVVFALRTPSGHRGTLPSSYGPEVGGERADVLRRLGRGGNHDHHDEPPGDPITEREAAEQALIDEGESEAGAQLGDQLD
jgi:hypothetical protein